MLRLTSTTLATVVGFSVLEVIQPVERATGFNVPVQRGLRRAGDPAALVRDATKARAGFGWQPKFAGLDEIVRTAWAIHQKAPSMVADIESAVA